MYHEPLSTTSRGPRHFVESSLPMPLHGHLWTLRPWFLHKLRPEAPPASVPWSTVLDDPAIGPVRITGQLTREPGARAIAIIVHGLGGDVSSHYLPPAASAAQRAGLASLRLNMRGAEGSGEDVYHAGLTADLRAAIASPELREFEAIDLLGYYMGGHLSLRYATEEVDPRVRAVAAVCPPIDLDRGAAAMDRPERWVYRRNILVALKAAYAAVAARRSMPAPIAVARAIGTLREWDARVIAPRFGFRSPEHYYAEASVGPRLGRLALPSLLVATEADPMIPADTVLPSLAGEPPLLDVRWIEGGHVGFPGALELGMGGETGLDPQIFRWLRAAG